MLFSQQEKIISFAALLSISVINLLILTFSRGHIEAFLIELVSPLQLVLKHYAGSNGSALRRGEGRAQKLRGEINTKQRYSRGTGVNAVLTISRVNTTTTQIMTYQ